jgi:hypothetical protein
MGKTTRSLVGTESLSIWIELPLRKPHRPLPRTRKSPVLSRVPFEPIDLLIARLLSGSIKAPQWPREKRTPGCGNAKSEEAYAGKPGRASAGEEILGFEGEFLFSHARFSWL